MVILWLLAGGGLGGAWEFTRWRDARRAGHYYQPSIHPMLLGAILAWVVWALFIHPDPPNPDAGGAYPS